MLLLTLRGTPTLYYGDEIGMTNGEIPPDLVQDCLERNIPGRGFGRDGARTPMLWTSGTHGGFTTGRPWLPPNRDVAATNVESQRGDPQSMLSLCRRLLHLRRSEPALAVGTYAGVPAAGTVLAYLREHTRRRMLVALNFGDRPQRLAWNGGGRLALSTRLDREGEAVGPDLDLRPDEGVVVEVLEGSLTSG